jgi:hypothetical protein
VLPVQATQAVLAVNVQEAVFFCPGTQTVQVLHVSPLKSF